jgi:type II secretory pathway pseudopilin PulG
VQNTAKKTQAKNDLVQIVTAVNAFYTEYGKYPLPAGQSGDEYTCGTTGISTKALFDALRGINPILNPRQIEFIKPADAKATPPRGGIGPQGDEQFYDPWGKPYVVRIDADYNNQMPNPYANNAGAVPLRAGVAAWSLGKDGATGTDKNIAPAKDDVISWQ